MNLTVKRWLKLILSEKGLKKINDFEVKKLEAAIGIEPMNKAFAVLLSVIASNCT
ncbi:MAG: hypothetical protein WKF90_00005 [Pyrinomonadaceae bacterium]